jgi:hypothetical protein
VLRLARRRLLAGLFALALVAFLAIKVLPTHSSSPPIEIRSEGSDSRLARSVLATGLKKLFPKSNGRWQVRAAPVVGPGSRCFARSAAYRSSTGRAVTAAYEFARWLEVRLESFVYVDAAAARRAASDPTPRQAYTCEGQVVTKELRSHGYTVDEPRVFPAVRIGGDRRSSRIEIPTRYGGRRYDWNLDSTSVRRGRVILVLGTVTAGPFEETNQALAKELAPDAP